MNIIEFSARDERIYSYFFALLITLLYELHASIAFIKGLMLKFSWMKVAETWERVFTCDPHEPETTNGIIENADLTT